MKNKKAAFGILILFAAFFYFVLRFKTLTDVNIVNKQSMVQKETITPNFKNQILEKSKFGKDDSRKKIQTLNEIFLTKNDNDPRLDKELKVLTADDKTLLEKMYFETKNELLNEKGTIVFLIGRNIDSYQDTQFLFEVLNENPCLSMEDCGKDTRADLGADEHSQMGLDVSLNYPKIVALHWIEKYFENNKQNTDVSIKNELIKSLENASRSNILIISKKAKEILEKYSP